MSVKDDNEARYSAYLAERERNFFRQIAAAQQSKWSIDDWCEYAEGGTPRRLADAEVADEALILQSIADVARVETEGKNATMCVDGILTARSVNFLIGDSGLGKTPLLLQCAVSVAAGVSFLGRPTTKGKVLVIDYENHGTLHRKLAEVAKASGVTLTDIANTLIVPAAQSAAGGTRPLTAEEVVKVVKEGEYALVVIDAFRGFCDGNENDAQKVMPLFRKMSECDTCWLTMHHVRKEDKKAPPPDLMDLNNRVLAWLQEAAGTRGVINQSFTRLAVIAPKEGADLFLRGFVKGTGEIGPFHLERIYDEDGETPLGYKLATSWSLLAVDERLSYIKVAGQTLSNAELTELLGERPRRKLLEAAKALQLVTEVGAAKTKGRKFVFQPLPQTKDAEKWRSVAALETAADIGF